GAARSARRAGAGGAMVAADGGPSRGAGGGGAPVAGGASERDVGLRGGWCRGGVERERAGGARAVRAWHRRDRCAADDAERRRRAARGYWSGAGGAGAAGGRAA